MLIKQKKTKNRNPNKVQGKGILDSIFSAITSKAAKEVAVNLSKTAATKLGEKAIEKATDKIFSAKKEPTKQTDVFTPQTRMLLDNIISRGSGIRRIKKKYFPELFHLKVFNFKLFDRRADR